ncbi:unnamed protein product [Phaedon cochleariae]|uniref:Uncharacterized protein n=1 Tax=Phaedon cochleariae TaxID=80249 RepID=A0A9N9X8B2_PHACE|nr:unnamed protein product [Phaedon cochleariae]
MYGKILKQLEEPRSYLVETKSGTFRRNRWHLVPAPYYQFTPNNFEFRNQVTPALSEVDDNARGNLNVSTNVPNAHKFDVNPEVTSENDNVRESCEDRVCDPVSEVQNNDSASVRSRSTRIIKRPSYLKDYVS